MGGRRVETREERTASEEKRRVESGGNQRRVRGDRTTLFLYLLFPSPLSAPIIPSP